MSQFKDQLMTALHDAVRYFNEDRDPNAAVVKAASAHDFNIDQTQRLIETFNTARTIFHYKSAADRSASFSLADPDAVFVRLFDTTSGIKTASAEPDYNFYSEPVRDFFGSSVTMEKAAEDESVKRLEGLTLNGLAETAMSALNTQRQMSKMAEDSASLASMSAGTVLTKLANKLSVGYQDELADTYARLVCGCSSDPELKPVLEKLAEFVPSFVVDNNKLASYKRTYVIDDSDLGEHIELLKEAKECMEAEAEMLALAGQLQKEADDFEKEYLEMLSPTFQETKDASASSLLIKRAAKPGSGEYTTKNVFDEPITVPTTAEELAKGKRDDAATIASAVSGMVADSAKKPVSNFIETGITQAFIAPQERANKALSERLKNVQRQIMLQDLITNDPVLSDESPETVANAYASLMQMAPEVASNKEIVRAVLRQTVHSVAVSPYDADMWTRLEQNLRNIKGQGRSAPVKESK